MAPEPSTTEKPPVEVVTETTEGFEKLRADGLSKFERNRRAILAISGTYRVSSDFMEIVGFAPGFKPARLYRGWGTEHVYVVEDDYTWWKTTKSEFHCSTSQAGEKPRIHQRNDRCIPRRTRKLSIRRILKDQGWARLISCFLHSSGTRTGSGRPSTVSITPPGHSIP